MFADVDFQQDLFDGVVRVVIGVFVIVGYFQKNAAMRQWIWREVANELAVKFR